MNLDEELEFILSFIKDKNDYYEMSTHEALKLVILAKAAKKLCAYLDFLDSPDGNDLLKALEDVEKQ